MIIFCGSRCAREGMLCSILVRNVWGITILVENIRVDPILVENKSDITESYKNVWVDKQPHPLYIRTALGLLKY